MFTSYDLSFFDDSYFQIVAVTPDAITIRSRNTGHSWQLVAVGPHYINILHKHKDRDPFHWHTTVESTERALEEIQGHDEFQLNHRRCPWTVYTREGVVKNGRLFRY